MHNNQESINNFFEGYGIDTAKEYGKTFFNTLSIIQHGDTPSPELLEDVTGKFSSLFSLISTIEPTS